MTIHFHTKHFLSTGLELIPYMMLLMYEDDKNPTAKVVQTTLNITERTVYRMKNQLIEQGYLKKYKGCT